MSSIRALRSISVTSLEEIYLKKHLMYHVQEASFIYVKNKSSFLCNGGVMCVYVCIFVCVCP